MPSPMSPKRKFVVWLCKIYQVNLFLGNLRYTITSPWFVEYTILRKVLFFNLQIWWQIRWFPRKLTFTKIKTWRYLLQNVLPTFIRFVSCTYMYEAHTMINTMNRNAPKQNSFSHLWKIACIFLTSRDCL